MVDISVWILQALRGKKQDFRNNNFKNPDTKNSISFNNPMTQMPDRFVHNFKNQRM